MYKLKTNPWKHQWEALDFLMTRKYAALFTDMGSGKTKVMIDLIVNKKFKTVLVVGTKKSCDVWKSEFDLNSDLQNSVYKLTNMNTTYKLSFVQKKLLKTEILDVPVVFLLNYESIWREPLKHFLYKQHFDCIICDESHKIKSPSSKVSICMAALSKRSDHRYILTGTPTPESPIDIYSQYKFLNPDIFGTNFQKFRDKYENLDVRKSMYAGYRVLDKKQPYKNLDELEKKIYSCAFYVKTDLDLPPVTHIYFDQNLSKKGQDIYRELNREGVYEDEQGITETTNVLAKHTRLQQLLSGYLAVEDESFTTVDLIEKDKSKIEALEYLLEEIPTKEKVVVFCKYRKDFENIEKLCKKINRTYGEISGARDDYNSWKNSRINLLAVQYSSGAESISLTEARYCIYYSHTFSYGQYSQSLKRTHRPGQKRPVTYYHIISKVEGIETVDDKIKKALSMKQSLLEYILSQNNT